MSLGTSQNDKTTVSTWARIKKTNYNTCSGTREWLGHVCLVFTLDTETLYKSRHKVHKLIQAIVKGDAFVSQSYINQRIHSAYLESVSLWESLQFQGFAPNGKLISDSTAKSAVWGNRHLFNMKRHGFLFCFSHIACCSITGQIRQ